MNRSQSDVILSYLQSFAMGYIQLRMHYQSFGRLADLNDKKIAKRRNFALFTVVGGMKDALPVGPTKNHICQAN